MGSAALLSDLGTEIVIPVCAVIGIIFSLVQWFLVSRVKLSPERQQGSNNKNGYNDYLIEEEEGHNDHNVVAKCADIQNAITEGTELLISYFVSFLTMIDLLLFLFAVMYDVFCFGSLSKV